MVLKGGSLGNSEPHFPPALRSPARALPAEKQMETRGWESGCGLWGEPPRAHGRVGTLLVLSDSSFGNRPTVRTNFRLLFPLPLFLMMKWRRKGFHLSLSVICSKSLVIHPPARSFHSVPWTLTFISSVRWRKHFPIFAGLCFCLLNIPFLLSGNSTLIFLSGPLSSDS